jgi:hypothetical protein
MIKAHTERTQKTNAEDHDDLATHVSHMPNYGEKAADVIEDKIQVEYIGEILAGVTGGGNVFFSWAVCGESFDNHDKTNEFSFLDCDECKAAWEKYQNSDQARADATAFYDIMKSGATYDGGTDSNPGAGITDWATDKTKDFVDLYP